MAWVKSPSGAISAFVNGAMITVPPDHMNYEQAYNELKAGNLARFEELVNLGKSIPTFICNKADGTEGDVQVIDGQVYYKGNVLNNVVTDRIIEFINKNLPYQPLVRFLQNLMLNPSRHSVRQLYEFLSHQQLPLTEDGCILAYKRVKSDWHDMHTGTIDNSVGKTPRMDRNEVDDDYSKDCSQGLHLGSIDFVRGFSNGGHILICKVNPRDCVAVPEGYTNKMRVCEYYVQQECDSNGLTDVLYRAEPGQPVEAILTKSQVNGIDPELDREIAAALGHEQDYRQTPAEENHEYRMGNDVFYENDNEDEDEDEDLDEFDDDEDEDEFDEDEDEFDEDEDEFDDDEQEDLIEELEQAEVVDQSDVNSDVVSWFAANNVSTDYLNDSKISDAVIHEDGPAVIQYLYAKAIQNNDYELQAVLENEFLRAALISCF